MAVLQVSDQTHFPSLAYFTKCEMEKWHWNGWSPDSIYRGWIPGWSHEINRIIRTKHGRLLTLFLKPMVFLNMDHSGDQFSSWSPSLLWLCKLSLRESKRAAHFYIRSFPYSSRRPRPLWDSAATQHDGNFQAWASYLLDTCSAFCNNRSRSRLGSEQGIRIAAYVLSQCENPWLDVLLWRDFDRGKWEGDDGMKALGFAMCIE